MITTSRIPYKNRNFIIESKDKELFAKMKEIVDAGFPPSKEPVLLELYRILWEKKRRLAYLEQKNGTIYIYFPKINPLVRLFGTIAMLFTSKDKDDDEEDEDSLRQTI